MADAAEAPKVPRPPTAKAAETAQRTFVDLQVRSLAPFDFVVIALPGPPFDAVRIDRDADGEHAVTVLSREPGEPFSDDQRAVLERLGFKQDADLWTGQHDLPDPGVVSALATDVLEDVFGVTSGASLDIRHGSTFEEHLAEKRIAEMRGRIAPVLASMLGREAEVDDDGDYLIDVGHVRVYVAPRALPARPPIVRVFAITNAGVNMTSELGMFLARLNFTLMFGRFTVDADHSAVWFDETLLGDHVTAEELRFTVEMVASTANEWDHKIAQLFGGTTRGDAPPAPSPDQTAPTSKPGQGGYL